MKRNFFGEFGEALEFLPEQWDAKVIEKLVNEELESRLKEIGKIFKERGSNPQDEEVINAYLILKYEFEKRKLEFHPIKDLETYAEKLLEGIRPAFGSPGGKRFLAKTICSYIPDHKIYVEPFVGGGAVFFMKKPSEVEVINDLNEEIVFAYKYLQRLNEVEMEKLSKLDWICNENNFKKLKELKAKSEAERFQKHLLTNVWSYGRNKSHFGRYDKRNINYAETLLKRLPKIAERLGETKIHNNDFLKCIKELDSENTFFYLDPPYPKTSSLGKIDMQELRKICENLRGKFILSLNDLEENKKLFQDFNIVEVETHHQMATGGGSFKREELLISNFPLKQSSTWIAESYSGDLFEGDFDNYILETFGKLKEIGEIILVPNYVSWTGSTLYAKDRFPNDLDIVVRDEKFPPDFTLKLNRVIQKTTSEQPCLHLTPQGPNWRHFPLYHLALIPVKNPEFVELGNEEPGFAKELYEQRAASPEILKQAEQSEKEDKIKIGRFFRMQKPTRAAKPNHRMTIDYFISLFEPEDFKAGILSSKKYDGFRVQIHKEDEKIKIFSEDGSDVTEKIPSIVEKIKKLRGNFILDAEIESWIAGKHMPREEAISRIHSKEIEDETLIANIFDILYFEGEISNEIAKVLE